MHDLDSGGQALMLESFKIPHPERILYPEAGISRLQVVQYYAEVAEEILRQARGRALTVKRWPHGIDGSMFYQKHPEPGRPLMISSTQELLEWVSRGALEWHAPLGLAVDPLHHDWAILDLDPNPPADWTQVVAVGRVVKELLEHMQVPFCLKTSGQRGLHFYVPICSWPHPRVTQVMGRWAELVVGAIPDLATVARLKRDRGARVYLDYLQNTHSRTTVMAFSLRATPSASVSAPIDWSEVNHPPPYWTMERTLQRLKRRGNPFYWTGARCDLGRVARQHGFLPKERGSHGRY